jgi:GNAT superfamily N-acetyltransferase
MTRRLLPRDEWSRLDGTESRFLLVAPAGIDADVIVVEDQGAIVATWVVMRCDHAEGFWIHPAHRGKAAALRSLLAGLQEVAETRGVSTVLTAAVDDQVAEMLRRYGATEIPPARHFMLPVSRTKE